MAGKANPGVRTEKAHAIHTDLDGAASLINSVHAQVLSRVIEAGDWKVHRDIDGFGGLCEWLQAKFDFHHRTAADLAAISRHAKKFTVLAEAATSGQARIDQVAAAVRALDKTPAMRLYARTPYREPVASPFNAAVSCATPEELTAQYCQHAPHTELRTHLAELEAACAGEDELFEDLSGQALARLEVWETDTGMWAVDGLVSSDTGALFAKLLTTAVPPPRAEDCEAATGQAQTDSDGESEAEAEAVLPAQANRNAEALHQMLASFGTDPQAPKRHGHTATLNLTCDIDTLQGKPTGRLPMLEGRPVSVAKARLLACEAGIIPSIFNYETGEAVELGRQERLPNTALRRKLELEQPEGCVWHGCGRPIQWTEAHHLEHWADGGKTEAANLILLCRFHHGRIHTPGWSVTKTGPGQAVIVHHEGHEQAPADMAEGGQADCGCADWRTDADLETEFASDASNVFPTGLYPTEWAPALKHDLNQAAEQLETETAWAAVKATRAKARARFTASPTTGAPTPAPEYKRVSDTEPACAATDPGPPPFLTRPPRTGTAAGGECTIMDAQPGLPKGTGPSPVSPLRHPLTARQTAAIPDTPLSSSSLTA